MVVTIDILPQQGWQIDKWVGPVYNIDGTTAQIQMDSSQAVAVRLKLTTRRTAIATPTPEARLKEEKSSQRTSTVEPSVVRTTVLSDKADKAFLDTPHHRQHDGQRPQPG